MRWGSGVLAALATDLRCWGECEAKGQMLSTTKKPGILKSTTLWFAILFIIIETDLFLPTISSGMIRIL